MDYQPKDTRIWQYRRMADGNTEGQIFASRAAIPAGEGWADSRGEALGILPAPVAPVANTFAELSIADQVAALEAAATPDAPETVDPDAPVEDPAAPPPPAIDIAAAAEGLAFVKKTRKKKD